MLFSEEIKNILEQHENSSNVELLKAVRACILGELNNAIKLYRQNNKYDLAAHIRRIDNAFRIAAKNNSRINEDFFKRLVFMVSEEIYYKVW